MIFNGKKKPANTLPMSNAHLFYSPIKGVNPARNLGIVHARGDVLLFLDDDCRLQNSDHLEKLLAYHASNADQMSVGGPYVLPKKTNLLARAYHHNQSAWLQSQSYGGNKTQVLLGGNASYKAAIFKDGTRFPPGIAYGGSETPLNVEIMQKYGPHHFSDSLSIEHASRLSPLSFIKKAYLQGKGSAFQKKFHSLSSLQTHKSLPHPSFAIRFLLWLYDFAFMVGYRTSIYERRHVIASSLEESIQRALTPFKPFLSDLSAAKSLAFSPPPSTLAPSHRIGADAKVGTPVRVTESLFQTLQSWTEKDFLHRTLWLDRRLSADAIQKDLHKISSFYGIEPETLPYATPHRTQATLTLHNLGDHVFVFCQELSENYKFWNRERVELASRKAPVTYLYSDNRSLTHKIWPRKLHPQFYPLDGVAIEKSVWVDYLTKNKDPFNHFSWNQYVQSHLCPPVRNSSKVGQPQNAKTLAHHAQMAFLNHPSRDFYRENAVLLGNQVLRRSLLVRFFLTLSSFVDRIPTKWVQAINTTTNYLRNRVAHWNLEAQEKSSLAYKWSAYAAHRFYWFLHKSFWMASEVYWFLYKMITFTLAQIVWRSFDGLMFVYLALNTLYWRLHVIFIGPAIGFFISLTEEPTYFKNLPWRDRYKQRTLLFLRKWAWLFLRGVKLR